LSVCSHSWTIAQSNQSGFRALQTQRPCRISKWCASFFQSIRRIKVLSPRVQSYDRVTQVNIAMLACYKAFVQLHYLHALSCFAGNPACRPNAILPFPLLTSFRTVYFPQLKKRVYGSALSRCSNTCDSVLGACACCFLR